jgi:hypothetical protein
MIPCHQRVRRSIKRRNIDGIAAVVNKKNMKNCFGNHRSLGYNGAADFPGATRNRRPDSTPAAFDLIVSLHARSGIIPNSDCRRKKHPIPDL